MSANLSAKYILVTNIDCSGTSFNTISGTFTGTLDGQNHTVNNLDITGGSLFSEMDGSATVENLTFTGGSVSQSGYGGTIASTVNATSAVINNVHSSMTIGVMGTSVAAYTGGLVGYDAGGLTISNSSFTGQIYCNQYCGGLAGVFGVNSSSSITNSYFNGTLSAYDASSPFLTYDAYLGGLVGVAYNGSISMSFSAGNLNYADGVNYIGGVAGVTYKTAFSNIFSAATIFGPAGISNNGGAFGIFYSNSPQSSTRSNIYYDSGNTFDMPCVGTDETSGNCTAKDIGGVDPNYFFGTSSAAPMNAWDFSTIWQTNASDYPSLRNEALFSSSGVPNSGDANGDGINDSYQANIISIKDANGVWSTVVVPSATGCVLGNASSLSPVGLPKPKYTAQVSFNAFSIYCPTSGATVPVTIIYDKQYDTSSTKLTEYNPTTKAYTEVPNATFSTVTIGGIKKTTTTYSITDGGLLDEDGLANGVIVDPVAMELPAVASAPQTGFGEPSVTPLATYALLVTGILSTVAGVIQVNRQRLASKK